MTALRTEQDYPPLAPYDAAYAKEPELPPDSTTRPARPAPAEYVDVAAVLAGDLHPPTPTIALRTDGIGLIYSGRDTVVFGDPETGKSLFCAHIAATLLTSGRGSVAWIDVDHNGAPAILSRLTAFGVPANVLADPHRFRLAIPDDAATLTAVITDLAGWSPVLAVIDSIGEIVPMFGRSSNSPDDWSAVHQTVIKPLTRRNVAALCVDHEAKNSDSKAFGTSGTAAKVRTVDGTMLRFTLMEPFAPGRGGAAKITLRKDRHGGLRNACAPGVREPTAAVFRLDPSEHELRGHLYAPLLADATASPEQDEPSDLDQLLHLVPPPKSVRDAQRRMHWQTDRAAKAMRLWRQATALPVSTLTGGETEQQLPTLPEALPQQGNAGAEQ